MKLEKPQSHLSVLKVDGGTRLLYLRVCRILTKMADAFSHLRGGSENCTVVLPSTPFCEESLTAKALRRVRSSQALRADAPLGCVWSTSR